MFRSMKFLPRVTRTFRPTFNHQRRFLNLHEYQAKIMMNDYFVKHQRGDIVTKKEMLRTVAERIQKTFNSENLILKAQVLAGGRGKGVFNTGFKGGVKFCKTVEDVEEYGKEMLGNRLVTKQTGEEGVEVNTLLVTECLDFENEYYLAILLDRESQGPVIIASKEGGMDIEDVAENNPDAIIKEEVNVLQGLTKQNLNNLAEGLGFVENNIRPKFNKQIENLYKMFIELDSTQVEINPLVKTNDNEVVCVDGKVGIDDNALFRHPILAKFEDETDMDPREVEAKKHDLSYVGLDGNIGCMVNGAGLAMSTMDIIKLYGGEPANFLDVGGSASVSQVTGAFKILTADPKVQCILVNIFGGIMRCDVIAEGVVEAAKTLQLKVPLVVRLSGTKQEEGVKILKESGLNIIPAIDLDEAARKSVEALKEQ